MAKLIRSWCPADDYTLEGSGWRVVIVRWLMQRAVYSVHSTDLRPHEFALRLSFRRSIAARLLPVVISILRL